MASLDRTRSEQLEPMSVSVSEATAGIVAIVLTILGLAHVAPTLLVAIATIAVGVALFFRGGAAAMALSGLVWRAGGASDLGGAWSMEFLGGAAGVVLGILALLNVSPTDLVAIAAIAFGGALLLSSGSVAQIKAFRVAALGLDESSQRAAGSVLSSSAALQALAGLAGVVLGILALAGFSPVPLVLIALLALGSFVLVNGPALSAALLSVLRR